MAKAEHCAEAFGYSFEKMVLYAWSLGIGTTWIGGTMKRELFEQEAGLKDGEIMPCVTPIGYPAKKHSIKEIGMRTAIKADKRIKGEELFFEKISAHRFIPMMSRYRMRLKLSDLPLRQSISSRGVS